MERVGAQCHTAGLVGTSEGGTAGEGRFAVCGLRARLVRVNGDGAGRAPDEAVPEPGFELRVGSRAAHGPGEVVNGRVGRRCIALDIRRRGLPARDGGWDVVRFRLGLLDRDRFLGWGLGWLLGWLLGFSR